jgi:hypothetical protein
MIENTKPQTLSEYTANWSKKYKQMLDKNELFQSGFAKNLTLEQRQKFIKYFYHIRGNFYTFLWFIGSLAPDVKYRKIALGNIVEEFGVTMSHEQWYMEFAAAHGVDLKTEIIQEKFNHGFIKTYNKGYIDYIINHDFDLAWSVFSAYELLDNQDYPSLQKFAKNIGTDTKSLTFFRIHANGNHYDSTHTLLQEIWDKDSEKAKQAFEFVAAHQLNMWAELYKQLQK